MGEVKVKFLNISLVLVLMLVVVFAQAADIEGAFIVIDDEASIKDVLEKITQGSGKQELETKDVYQEDNDGKAALRINVKAETVKALTLICRIGNYKLRKTRLEKISFVTLLSLGKI